MSNAEVYPIGQYVISPFSEVELRERLAHLRDLPRLLESAVANLSADQLQESYREGTWSVHQLLHHICDSHLVGFLRCKLVLTEDEALLPVYPQDAFAQTQDVAAIPSNHALTMLHVLHARWHELMNAASLEDLERTGFHPEQQDHVSLWYLLGLYAWHGRHHAMQIIRWRERMEA